jgi:hypothetical protein
MPIVIRNHCRFELANAVLAIFIRATFGRIYPEIGYFLPPLENFILVDHHGLNDQITTTTPTRRCRHFRDVDVKERYGPFCVIFCDAAHLIKAVK